MKVLVTGFAPFGGSDKNISYEAVKLLPQRIADADVVTCELPTAFGKSTVTLQEEIAKHNPDIVICVGVAGKRTAITPERVAINIMDARMADNNGYQPVDEPIVEDGPTAYFSTLPIKAMVAAMNEVGVPAMVSNTAGTYVCNYTMYSLLHHIAKEGLSIMGGFIHVPGNTLPLDDIVKALTLCIETAITENLHNK